jgi:type I restriction enzyme S subunit
MTLQVNEPPAKYLVRQSPRAAAVGELPHDWALVRLIDVAEVRGGVAKNANVAISDPIDVAYLRVANVQDGYLDLGDVSKIKINKVDLKRYSLLPGDVLMNEGGDLDKLGRGALWRGEIETCVHQNHVFSVRCKPQLLGDYLNVWTGSASARRFFLLAGKQTTNLASISKSSLGEMPVFLPRLEEQRAIAAALSDVDALVAGLEKLIAKKRDLKQAAMQQLLTGQTRLPGFSGYWCQGYFGDVVTALETGVSVNSIDTEPAIGTPCVLKTSALVGGRFLPNEAKVIEARDIRRARTTAKGDTILISRMNTPTLVGEVAYVARDFDSLFLPDRVWMARFNASQYVNVQWMAFVLSSQPYRDLLREVATGTSGSMKNISKGALLSLPIQFPSSEEQSEIATVLSDMDAALAILETRLAKTRALKQGMMQELLTGRTRLA